MSDTVKAIRNVGVMLVLFLLIIWVAQSERTVAIAVAGAVVGVAAPIIFAAFEKEKASLKVVIGWGVIGLLFGLAAGLWGV